MQTCSQIVTTAKPTPSCITVDIIYKHCVNIQGVTTAEGAAVVMHLTLEIVVKMSLTNW